MGDGPNTAAVAQVTQAKTTGSDNALQPAGENFSQDCL
jgi:hypothetical protein